MTDVTFLEVVVAIEKAINAKVDYDYRPSWVLGSIGIQQSILPLRQIVQNKHLASNIRAVAVDMLGKIGDVDSINILLAFIKDQNEDLLVKRAAIISIGLLKHTTSEVIEALLSNTREPSLIGVIAVALVTLKAQNIFEILSKILVADDLNNRGVLMQIVDAVISLEDKRNFDLFVQMLKTKKLDKMITAVHGLAKLKHKETTEFILEILREKQDEQLSIACLYALEQIEGSDSTKYIIPLLKSSNENVASTAALIVNHTANNASLEAILDNLKSSNPLVRFYLIGALGKLKNPKAIPTLTDIAKNDRSDTPLTGKISNFALETIQKILKDKQL